MPHTVAPPGAARAVERRFDVERVRADFPILSERVHGRPLVYLDTAATAQKPQAVLDAVADFYRRANANVHRGVHRLSELATELYEGVRPVVKQFVNASDAREIVFVRGTTEAVNLVAQTVGRTRLGPGAEVVVSAMEHHSNIVPWQMICEQTGARLRVIPVTDAGETELAAAASAIGDRTKIAALAHVSNALGSINPVKAIGALAHAHGAVVMLDGAQAAPHLRIDVQDLDCDFYAFSGHKMFGPTGIGVLYGRLPLLEAAPPWQGGGDMISEVSFDRTTFNVVPHKFEAGTPNIAGAVGLRAAIEYLDGLDRTALEAHERDLLAYATGRALEIPGLRIIGTTPHKIGVLSFVMDCAHPHDVGTVLDREGVAVRTGHHCCMPLMERFGVPGTTRASFAVYNTRADIDALADGLLRVREMFG